MFFLLFVAELSCAVAVLAFVARVTWLLGVAPSHETQKGVAGYRLLVTRVSGLKGLLVSSQSYSFVPNG